MASLGFRFGQPPAAYHNFSRAQSHTHTHTHTHTHMPPLTHITSHNLSTSTSDTPIIGISYTILYYTSIYYYTVYYVLYVTYYTLLRTICIPYTICYILYTIFKCYILYTIFIYITSHTLSSSTSATPIICIRGGSGPRRRRRSM